MALSCQARGRQKVDNRQKNHKDLHGVKIGKRMVREGMEKSFLDLMSWEEAIYLHDGYFSS